MAAGLSINLDDIKKGLLNNPRCISAELIWACKHGQERFEKRRRDNGDYYLMENRELKHCVKKIGKTMPNKLAIFDLGSSVTASTTTFMDGLVEENPDVEICYVPVDMSDIILTWRDHLKANFPHLNEKVVHIEPIVGDMLETVRKSDTILEGTEWQQWDRVFVMFGPTAAVLSQNFFIDLMAAVGSKTTEGGGFMFTYMQEHENTEERLYEVWDSKVDLLDYYKSFLEGMSEITDADLSSDWFDYKHFYLANQTTPGVDGTWTGKQIMAFAKEDLQFTCGKLGNLQIALKKGEAIRLSSDYVKTYHFSPKYIASLAEKSNLQACCSTIEDENVMACVFLTNK